MNQQSRSVIFARYIVGCFLILSGMGKLIDSTTAVETVRYITMSFAMVLPEPLITTMLLSILEIIFGIMFLLGKMLQFVSLSSCFILAMFALPLKEILIQGISVPYCGCSGIFDFGMSPATAATINSVVYLFILWIILVIQHGNKFVRKPTQ